MTEDKVSRQERRTDELLRTALESSVPSSEIPSGFRAQLVEKILADNTPNSASTSKSVRHAKATPQKRNRAVFLFAACFSVFVLLFAFWYRGGVAEEGQFATTTRTSMELGRRAVLVAEPGSEGRYEVAGLLRARDQVVLQRGSIFLRVERGRPFDVVFGNFRVEVLGTCFRVDFPNAPADARSNARPDANNVSGDSSMINPQQTRAFALGAGLSAIASIVVYEGRVRVVHAASPPGTVSHPSYELAAGTTAHIAEDGRLVRADTATDAPNGDPQIAQASAESAHVDSSADVVLRAENMRLREYLTQHGISPDTGARSPSTGERDGLEEPGETDLTPEEWRTLAGRGELRFAIPGSPRNGINEEVIEAFGLGADQAQRAREIVLDAHQSLHRTMAALYQEATGSEPGSLSVHAMSNEVADKTSDREASSIRFLLAQERGGLSPARVANETMSPYERMLRAMVAFEGDLERRLSEVVGPQRAHEMIFGSNRMSGSSFGMRGSR